MVELDLGTPPVATHLMATSTVALMFQVGARTLGTIPKRLVRLSLSLADVLAGTQPELPPLPSDADGYLVTSLPETRLAGLIDRHVMALVRQRYSRYHVDLAAGEAAWLSGLSSTARTGIKRKAKKLAAANDGLLDVRRYHRAEQFATFYPLARRVSAKTYQEKLLGSGLPADPASVRALSALAEEDGLRAWLVFLQDAPIAYLCCTADGDTLRYTYVGHDPVHSALSPGAVLQVEALRDLFAEGRFARFDFTEGEGQHKRQFSSAGTACVDVLLLRPTLANRSTLLALRTFDAAIALAKRAATVPLVDRLAKKIRR
ncbi:hypothetical protein HMP09_1651 [Sphingomonas sp. HMP9]|uniref:GNAT family N-acetyltransferase n=1 Tax=Sphingomonas sp. HMP9 TaxID=1517554 RepID=UPI001596FBD8|nr:GNAT family N-acetyltransferase [Sphingomonas sp. HMP9]BCA62417.1 hypothetical protein HMP09_1651 [Sphingomonas sp. HMP9]